MKTKFQSLFVFFLSGVILISCGRSGKNQATEKETSIYYSEQYRPQFHFSPPTGWMNDPNGLVYLDGEYHLFYQHYPDSTVWGPMHWGHAVSTDLLHWEQLPVALYPDSLGYIFSGSAVADTKNTSGLGTGNNLLVAVFTYHNPNLERSGSNTFQNQGIAYSNDKGRTWIKFPGNPVLKSPGIRDFRDPRVIWHEETKRWIMILAVHDKVQLYSSPNLIDWSYESEFGKNEGAHGGVWECPDLFPLKVNSGEETRWVMLVSINPGGPNGGSATQYFTGEFDGHKFISDDTCESWIDYGTDDYAGVTWSNIPKSDGRRIFIGWMSNWIYANTVPTKVWRSAMTIPRELSLIRENESYKLISQPVKEIELLRDGSASISFKDGNYSGESELSTGDINLTQCELIFEFDLEQSKSDTLGIAFENEDGEKYITGYSVKTRQVFIDRTNSGNTGFSTGFAGIAVADYSAGSKLLMHLIVDASSAELFIDDGKLVMTTLFFPGKDYSKLKLFSKGGSLFLERATLHELRRVWP